jgi:hypothetical protein
MGVLNGGLGYFVVGSTRAAGAAESVGCGSEVASTGVAMTEAAKPLPIPPRAWRLLTEFSLMMLYSTVE